MSNKSINESTTQGGPYPYANGERNDCLVNEMVELTLRRLLLTGHELKAATELVLGIMKNAGDKHKVYYQYAVLCGAYPNGAVVDGVAYNMGHGDQTTDIDYRRKMLMALVSTIDINTPIRTEESAEMQYLKKLAETCHE